MKNLLGPQDANNKGTAILQIPISLSIATL